MSENDKSELQQSERSKMKPRVTKLRLYEVFAALFFAIAGFFLGLNFLGFNLQWLALWSTIFLFGGLILSGFALRLWLINNHKLRRKANFWFCVVAIPSTALCVGLGVWILEYRSQRAASVAINSTLSTEEQLRATQFAAALGDPAVNIVMILALKEPIRFTELCPLRFGFRLIGDVGGEPKVIDIQVSDDPTMKFGQMMSFYSIKWAFMPEGKQKATVHEYAHGNREDFVTNIVIQFRYRPKEGEPFGTLRSFNGALINPWLPDNLLARVRKVGFIVNGWHLLNADPSAATWKVGVSNSAHLLSSPVEMSIPWKDVDLYTPWSTNFQQRSPPRSLWRLQFLDRVPLYDPACCSVPSAAR